MNFLNEKNLPIVAHNVEYNRDDVLKPAFERLGIKSRMPKDDRWRCTFMMAERDPKIKVRSLDAILKHYRFKPRKNLDAHDAVEDCQLTAKIYMKLIALPPPRIPEPGYCTTNGQKMIEV